MKRSVHKKNLMTKYLLLVVVGMSLAFLGKAQTYTTIADGNWTSATTWAGGVVPSRTISASMVVNINHDVNINVTGDISIAGVLNIVGDTLRAGSSFDKNIIVNSSGLLKVQNGGLLTYLAGKKNNLTVNGGRAYFENAKVVVSKTFTSIAGGKRAYKNSLVHVGENYSLVGTNASVKSIDSIMTSTIESALSSSGAFSVLPYGSLRVSNATVTVNTNSSFVTSVNSDITVLSGAVSNYGFNRLRIVKDLDVSGAWDARIDAHCIDGNIKGSNMAAIDFTRSEDCSTPVVGGTTATAPELIFKNPVLKSGQANKEGAVYRFPNVTTGVDAEIKLKKFSRPQIVMQNIDLANMGWDKAFQPQFGLPGVVAPFQNWYIDFELTFYNAGTNQKKTIAKVDFTALDVDGDGWSISEYAQFENPSNVIYSTVSYLSNQPAGLTGQSFPCVVDGISSTLISCSNCGGDGKAGMWNIDPCTPCGGTGLVHSACNHAFDGINGSTVMGPVENFTNIDTAATQVMATYQYVDVEKIKFRYGAKSGVNSSNGSGIRLNSLWFRQFSMSSTSSVLPVKLSNFAAFLNKKDVNLSWTGHEENFSHYVLQRSTDGKTFTDVAVIFAAGNGSRNGSEYKYKDANVASATGAVFYRLQLVDNVKEAAQYSDVRVIRLAKETASLQLATYPNPVVNQVRVTLPSEWQGKPVMLELYTANGVRLQSLQLGAASQTETLDVSKASKGFYLVKATCEGQSAQQRIVKN